MRRSLACAFLIVLGFTTSVQAALPFLTQEQRLQQAQDIVEGRVTKVVETIKEKYSGYADYRYEVTMEVTKVLQGGQKVGATMTFHYWTVAERPEGMCGDNGQFISESSGLVIRAGKTIRIFSFETEKGHQLLKPNGFDMVPVEAPNYFMTVDG